MLFELASSKSIAEIDRDLRELAARQKFGVLAVHDLKETMRAIRVGPRQKAAESSDCLVCIVWIGPCVRF
jgi:hypothetical protein